MKQSLIPQASSNALFLFMPFLSFFLALISWLVIPLDFGIAISELVGGGLLVLLAISELGIYGVVLSGWASNSKFSFLGSLRSTAQMISYSVGLSLIV